MDDHLCAPMSTTRSRGDERRFTHHVEVHGIYTSIAPGFGEMASNAVEKESR